MREHVYGPVCEVTIIFCSCLLCILKELGGCCTEVCGSEASLNAGREILR